MNSREKTRKSFYFCLVCILLAATLSEVHASEVEELTAWKRVKNKDGIEIFRAHTETSRLKTFRVVSRFELEDIRSYIGMILDGDSYPDWGHMISSAEITPGTSVFDYSVYMTTHLPWPVKNRHVKLDYEITQKEDYSIYIKVIQSKNPPEEKKNYILSPEAHGYFALNTIPDSKEVELVTEVLVDPGGYVPAFFVNLITDDISFYSTKKIRKYVTAEKYQGLELDFIKRRPWVLGTVSASNSDTKQ